MKYLKRRARLEECVRQTEGTQDLEVKWWLLEKKNRLGLMRVQIARDRNALERDIIATFGTRQEEIRWMAQLEEESYSKSQRRESHMMDLGYSGVVTAWRETDLIPPILYLGVESYCDSYYGDMGLGL
ncbi:hypothetical protein KIPB_002288 [Kipferlia bialata]|uniref:Uncharacterized protein n=1 Tax=Kipferlia bialata TaxID=797122 RepID=A0A9K3GGJ2_9EUKA|nr:hypothetical protein KIPB_002288 [Kipferlia bialata]|eukprot:g2288.t1